MPSPTHTQEGSRSLAARFDALRRRKGTAILTSVAVLAASLPFVIGLPSLYRAGATVLVERPGVDPASLSGDVQSRLETIEAEALSRTRLEALADQFGLYMPRVGRMSTDARVALLQRDIKIETINTDQTSGRPAAVAFRISYVGRDPQIAANVANTLASFYVAQNDRMRTMRVTETAKSLQEQLAATQKTLAGQEDKVRAFTTANMGALPEQIDANLAALERLNTQLRLNGEQQIRLMERRQTLQHDIVDVGTKPSPDPNDPAVRLEQLNRHLADLRASWTDEYSEVKQTKAQIVDLEREIAANGQARSDVDANRVSQKGTLETSLAETVAQLQQLAKDSQELRDQIATYERRVESAPAHEPGFQAVTRDYQSTRDVYDGLLKRYDQATLAERVEGSGTDEFRVLDPAIPAADPTGPNRLRLLVIAVLLSLMLGVGLVIVLDLFDTSFHSVDDLRAFTRVPVLASIPLILVPESRVRRGTKVSLLAVAGVLLLAIVGAGAFHVGQGSEQLARLLLRVG